MIEPNIIIGYLRRACVDILARGTIDSKHELALRPTQRQGCEEFLVFLNRGDLTDKQKLTGFWELPQGIGKTAFVGAITDRVRQYALADGYNLRVGIVSSRINLLNQIRDDELVVLFPDLRGQVGVYGGRLRELDYPVTVITYESWPNLPKPDLLFSDEGHRGTTDDRALHLATVYPDIARYAVTATAHYDPTRTVYNTHRNLIFEKHIAASVRDGELASYIQTQAYIIRVIPGKDEDVKLARQLAFNQFVDRLLINGRDQRTGDLLTDNQGGVFVEDTTQSDHLADLLNRNPHYQGIARKNGCDAFAVSIHTVGISGKEQERREKAYKEGRYWYVVGDEKLTEGFNFKPLKTVVDSPHFSWVKKAQILGRGDREYLNKKKNRYEGMTFVDTIMYIGCNPSDDPDNIITPAEAHRRDKNALKRAKAYAITAFKVLDGNVEVSGPSAPPLKPLPPAPPVDTPPDTPILVPPIDIPPAPPIYVPPIDGPSVPPGPLGPPIEIPPPPILPPFDPFEGLQVTSYATLDDVRTLLAEQQKFLAQIQKEDLTEDQVVGWIKDTKEKTGKYPSEDTDAVWCKDSEGNFQIVEGETWRAITECLRNGFRGLGPTIATSLPNLRNKHGLVDVSMPGLVKKPLTEEKIIEWIKATREKTGKYPSKYSEVVWCKKADGGFEVVEGENWTAINDAFEDKLRGLVGVDGSTIAKSLADFRRKKGLVDKLGERRVSVEKLTEDLLVELIKATKEQTGEYPTTDTKTIWRRKENGGFEVVEGETGMSINGALINKGRGLINEDGSAVATSLSDFRKKHGLIEKHESAHRKPYNQKLTEAQLIEWNIATWEKTGQFLSGKTKVIWGKDANGAFTIVPAETGRSIDQALKRKGRGLMKTDGSPIATSLVNFKETHGFNGDYKSAKNQVTSRAKPAKPSGKKPIRRPRQKTPD